jgi:hypothetical protein
MASLARSRRGVSPKTLAITLVLVIALVAAGASFHKAFFSGRAKPTGVDATESLPQGQLAPPEAIEAEGQGGRPQTDRQ